MTDTEKFCERKTMRLACAADELLVIDDAFYGRRERKPRCGCNRISKCRRCTQKQDGLLRSVRSRCQGSQQCKVKVENAFFGDPCEGIKRKYLEVTFHCKEAKENVTFGGKGEVPGKFQLVGGLAVSSTNEIFVTDGGNKRIQVFSMKGVFLHSFSTGNLKPHTIATGYNDTLWVILKKASTRNDFGGKIVHQYSKEGHVLGKFTCSGTRIDGIAWHKLSDRFILSLTKARVAEAVWFSPTYTQTQVISTGNITRFGSTGLGHNYFKYGQSVAVDKKGNIFMADKDHSCVFKYDKSGVYLSSFGSKGSGAGELDFPTGICVDSLGRVIVADSWNSRVEMFTAEGKYIRTVAYMKLPKHVATGGEGQLVVSNMNQDVTILLKY